MFSIKPYCCKTLCQLQQIYPFKLIDIYIKIELFKLSYQMTIMAQSRPRKMKLTFVLFPRTCV